MTRNERRPTQPRMTPAERERAREQRKKDRRKERRRQKQIDKITVRDQG